MLSKAIIVNKKEKTVIAIITVKIIMNLRYFEFASYFIIIAIVVKFISLFICFRSYIAIIIMLISFMLDIFMKMNDFPFQ